MLKKIYFAFLIIPFFLIGDDHKAQGNSADWEIEAYTTSAPDFIGNFATVVGASGEVLREGTNGWTCLPFIAMPKMGFKTKNEAAPACADKNAMACKRNRDRHLSGQNMTSVIGGRRET